MSKQPESDLYGTSFSTESIKVIAESIGIGNLPDDAAKELADDISFRIKHIIQDAAKFMHHAKRTKLMNSDVDSALKLKNLEPHYGFSSNEHLPFRFASGGGRELHFIEEKEVDLNDLINKASTKAPLEVTLRAHWLCIEGVQPTIPENPPPVTKEMQKLETVDPIKGSKPNKETSGKPTIGKQRLRNVETVQIKQLATHELSVEQQLYYKELTEACVGSDEARRHEALQSLTNEPGLHEMLPRMCTFIVEGVRVNVVQNNLAILIYLMRMTRALADNQTLYLEKYLHELIPAILTCSVAKQLCQRPDIDNHWALRDFAGRLGAQLCKTYNSSTNNIQTRLSRMYANAIQQGDKLPLASLYGCLIGIMELGQEVVRAFILPKLKAFGQRLEAILESNQMISNMEKVAAGHVKQLLVKMCTPVLKSIRNPPDYLDDYRNEYGYLGIALQNSVYKYRLQPPPPATTTSSSVLNSITTVGQTIARSIPTSSSIIQQNTSQSGRTLVMNQATGRMSNTSGNQKIVFVTQRSQTPGGTIQQNQPTTPTQQSTVVKFVSNANTQSQQKIVTTQQKLVVVCMPNTSTTTTVSSIQSTGIQQQNVMGQNQQQIFVQKAMLQQQKLKEQQMMQQNSDDLSHLS